MNTACIRGLMVDVFALCISCVLACPRPDCQSNPNAPVKMMESRVILKAGTKSDCSECGPGIIELSPDGADVARLRTDFDQKGQGRITVEVTDVRSARVVATFNPSDPPFPKGGSTQGFDSLHYCDSGKYLLAVSAWLGKAYVLDTKTYQPHAAIDIVTSSVRSALKQNSGHDTIFRADCAANGNIAAFQTSPNGTRPSFGSTRIYNLDSGEEVSGLGEIALLPLVGGVVVSPSGNSIAVLTDGKIQDGQIWGDYGSFLVMDLQTNSITRRIRWGDSSHLHALMFSFAGESNVVIESEEITGDLRYPEGNPTLHFWDIETGSEVQVIKDLGHLGHDVNEFKFDGLSADGLTVLAYTGKSHKCNSCNKHTGQVKVNEARFSLLDRESGKLIAMSPSLKVIHHGCPMLMISMGTCDSFDETPFFELSQSGNAVAVWYASGGEPVTVYTLNPPSPTH